LFGVLLRDFERIQRLQEHHNLFLPLSVFDIPLALHYEHRVPSLRTRSAVHVVGYNKKRPKGETKMDELKSIWRECIKSDDQDGGIQQAEEKCMTSHSMSLQAAMMKLL
jgi:hypothetical protein